jgi:hypothetical protein
MLTLVEDIFDIGWLRSFKYSVAVVINLEEEGQTGSEDPAVVRDVAVMVQKPGKGHIERDDGGDGEHNDESRVQINHSSYG